MHNLELTNCGTQSTDTFCCNHALCCCCRQPSAQIFTDAKPQILKPPTQSSAECERPVWGLSFALFLLWTHAHTSPPPLNFPFGHGKIWQISDTQLAKWEDMLTLHWPLQNLNQECQKGTCYSQHNTNFKLPESYCVRPRFPRNSLLPNSRHSSEGRSMVVFYSAFSSSVLWAEHKLNLRLLQWQSCSLCCLFYLVWAVLFIIPCSAVDINKCLHWRMLRNICSAQWSLLLYISTENNMGRENFGCL